MWGKFWTASLGVAGFGAVGAFVLWSNYQKWLDLPIFSRLTSDQSFWLFFLFIVLTFVFAVVAAILWFLQQKQHGMKKRAEEEALQLEAGYQPLRHKVESLSKNHGDRGVRSRARDLLAALDKLHAQRLELTKNANFAAANQLGVSIRSMAHEFDQSMQASTEPREAATFEGSGRITTTYTPGDVTRAAIVVPTTIYKP